MRTLIVSDLHLGLPSRRDVLRERRICDALVERLATADRVVLLGDFVELLEGTPERALECAHGFLGALAEALGPAREVILVPGNHDHQFATAWLAARVRAGEPPLALEEAVPVDSSAELASVVETLGATNVRVAYPGVWLRDDVYAMHGHYLDAHLRPPPPLRLVWPVWREWLSPPGTGATPSDYERSLARAYAGVARQARARHPLDAGAVERTLRTLAFAGSALVPGAGDGSAQVSLALMTAKLRTGGLDAVAAVVEGLGIRAEHVIFGHVHRAGPLPKDDAGRWRTPSGARLHNPGGWIRAGLVPATSPYAAGRYIELTDGAPPKLARLAEPARARR